MNGERREYLKLQYDIIMEILTKNVTYLVDSASYIEKTLKHITDGSKDNFKALILSVIKDEKLEYEIHKKIKIKANDRKHNSVKDEYYFSEFSLDYALDVLKILDRYLDYLNENYELDFEYEYFMNIYKKESDDVIISRKSDFKDAKLVIKLNDEVGDNEIDKVEIIENNKEEKQKEKNEIERTKVEKGSEKNKTPKTKSSLKVKTGKINKLNVHDKKNLFFSSCLFLVVILLLIYDIYCFVNYKFGWLFTIVPVFLCILLCMSILDDLYKWSVGYTNKVKESIKKIKKAFKICLIIMFFITGLFLVLCFLGITAQIKINFLVNELTTDEISKYNVNYDKYGRESSVIRKLSDNTIVSALYYYQMDTSNAYVYLNDKKVARVEGSYSKFGEYSRVNDVRYQDRVITYEKYYDINDNFIGSAEYHYNNSKELVCVDIYSDHGKNKIYNIEFVNNVIYRIKNLEDLSYYIFNYKDSKLSSIYKYDSMDNISSWYLFEDGFNNIETQFVNNEVESVIFYKSGKYGYYIETYTSSGEKVFSVEDFIDGKYYLVNKDNKFECELLYYYMYGSKINLYSYFNQPYDFVK